MVKNRIYFMERMVAEYYNEELADWNQITGHCIEEALDFEQRLTDIIRRDSIPAVAASAEHFLQRFELLQQQFLELQNQVEVQESKLVLNNLPVDDKKITDQTILNQSVLRKKMFQTEKDFLDAKYGCYEFFSGILHLPH
jgi:hypothetical protein